MDKTQTRRIAAGVLAVLLASAGGKAAMAQDVASVLQSDARFSDYVWTIKTAGLWSVLQGAKNVTIFAPTNEAFAALGPDWRANLLPRTLQDIEDTTLIRSQQQSFVLGAQVPGTYPEDQFRGQITRVRAASGYYFTVDGSQPGRLVINPRPASTQVVIDSPPPKEGMMITADTPIVANNGLIYPTDGFATTYEAQR
jgi:Fasciclin domain